MDIREYNLSDPSLFYRRHPWELARFWAVLDLLKSRPSSATGVLDFGAGDLFVALGIHRELKTPVSSIDSAYTEKLLRDLKSTGDGQVDAYTSVQAWEKHSKGGCGTVLLLDVLEHCKNEDEILQSIAASRGVSGEATWIATVPAFSSLFTRHDTFLGHYRRYTYPEFRAVFERNGFEVVDGGYFFSSLLLPRFFGKVRESLGLGSKAEPKGLASFRPPSWIGKSIASVLYMDFLVGRILRKIGLRMPGLSCYVLARKGKSGASSKQAAFG